MFLSNFKIKKSAPFLMLLCVGHAICYAQGSNNTDANCETVDWISRKMTFYGYKGHGNERYAYLDSIFMYRGSKDSLLADQVKILQYSITAYQSDTVLFRACNITGNKLPPEFVYTMRDRHPFRLNYNDRYYEAETIKVIIVALVTFKEKQYLISRTHIID